MFVCKSCELAKAESEYRFHKRGYRIGKCKSCERAYQRDITSKDPDKYRARKRESMARKRAANPEAARTYQKDYYAANRAVQTEKMRNYYARRFFWGKAMKLRGDRRACAKDLASLWRSQKGRCALTGRRLDRTAQLDHKMPKARGGGDEATNLQWLCCEANLAKRDLTDAEFAVLCEDVMRWIGRRIVDATATEPPEWPESRIDAIGQNGNDGAHYEVVNNG